jgi:uncharacterized protein (DUF302 family)
MTYHFTKVLNCPFDDAVTRATQALADQGFGVLTTIDVAATMKAKLGAEMKPYIILGACNPHFAYRALQAENKIGTMLPCNVVVQDMGNGKSEVSAVNPLESMSAINNADLAPIAGEVTSRLQTMIDSL